MEHLTANDLKKGNRFVLGVTVLSEQEIIDFAKAFDPLDFHTDKEEAEKVAAEKKSKTVIEAYHFLVSIAPETHALNAEEYTRITTTSNIEDFDYKEEKLKIIFQDNVVYEYFGVPKNTYIKFVNAPSVARFAKRHIFHSFTFRNVSK